MADARDTSGSAKLPIVSCLVACVGVLLVLVGAVSLVIHHSVKEPGSPYQVTFSESGAECDKDSKDLRLNRVTGEVLYCSVLPIIRYGSDSPTDVGAFTAEEVARVLVLSHARATDGGLDEADVRAVEELVETIGRENGRVDHPASWIERVTGAIGLKSLIVGLVTLFVLGLYADHATD